MELNEALECFKRTPEALRYHLRVESGKNYWMKITI